MSKRRQREYPAEFKQDAVALMRRQREEGRTLAAIARDLGVSPQVLRYWERRLEAPTADALPNAVAPLQLEVKRLRRELEQARQERDFLKRAAAFFAKESP